MEASELQQIYDDAVFRALVARTLGELRVVESETLGKRSPLSALHQRLGSLSPDERREAGRTLNETRARIEGIVARRRGELEADERRRQLDDERLDLTEVLPGPERGHLHLVTQTRDALEDVFVGMGFGVAEGPEVETDWYNFEALNIPPAHPARSLWDTLYLKWGEPESTLLRTHTSPVQIRVMQSQARRSTR